MVFYGNMVLLLPTIFYMNRSTDFVKDCVPFRSFIFNAIIFPSTTFTLLKVREML